MLKSKVESLNQIAQAISTELYKAGAEQARAAKGGAGSESAAGAGQESSRKDKQESPIIDAEVVDEKKS